MGKLYSLQSYRITGNVDASEIPQSGPEKSKKRRKKVSGAFDRRKATKSFTQMAEENGIHVFAAQDRTYGSIIGIHLLNPGHFDMVEALNKAIEEGWPAIVLHTDDTWPKKGA